MSGSGASNLGYGNITPGSNINGNYVNIDNSHYPGGFGSNQVPGLPGLSGAKYNVDAAAGINPGICLWKGGLRKKIKNITKMYKMKGGKSRKRSVKRKLRNRFSRGAFYKLGGKNKTISRRHKRSRRFRGGYAQYQNNLPLTPTYSVGGILSSNEVGLANPPIYKTLSNCTNCQDNYNHFTNSGFPSRGH
jgi:hypothetical protein